MHILRRGNIACTESVPGSSMHAADSHPVINSAYPMLGLVNVFLKESTELINSDVLRMPVHINSTASGF